MNLLATLTLGLALGSALASSVAAREGNWARAVGLAAFSLVLALVISLTVVPHLLNRVRGERLSFRFRTTKEGWFFLLTLSTTGVAAFNSGNNLLFVIFSMELAILLVSEILSTLNVALIQTNFDLPDQVIAEQPFQIGVRVRNRKPIVPSFALQFESVAESLVRRGCRRVDEIPVESPPKIFGLLDFLASAAEAKSRLSACFLQRGRQLLTNVAVSSRFPFGFIEKTKRVVSSHEILVLPALEAPNEFFETLPMLSGTLESNSRGWGSSLHLLREYSIQDSARFIDWKASAKTETIQLREFTREEDQKCCFVFDNSFPGFNENWRPAFEKAIVLCANAVRHFHEMSYEIRLLTPEASTAFSKDSSGLHDILKILAMIEPSQHSADSLSALARDKAFNIIFSASPRGDIPTTVWNTSHVIFIREL
ncbi:MAG: DUF58 domain-containing protein [Terriglobia bacterium]